MVKRKILREFYFQIELAPESREITTFITKKGLFRYTRLMFGISCAPEIFQKIMEQILSNCAGCVNFIDDILVFGTTKEEHDANASKVLATLKENNIGLNDDKCVHGVEKVKFLGHNLSSSGITPTNDKVEAIKQFRAPQTAEETRSFLGLVNYLGKFIPDLATITEPLRQLTKKSVIFKWNKEQQDAFDELKQMMCSDMLLGYYDKNDKTLVFADASPVGLGAVLVQLNKSNESRIIMYASKSLSDIEKRYAQTEKEALALVWAVERFYFYIYGKEFDLITDHKPLEFIFGPKSKPCLRIERWVLRLQSFKYKVIYKSGKTNIADPLSRLVQYAGPDITFDENAEHYVNAIVSLATPVALKLIDIQNESAADETIQKVKKALETGEWSESVNAYKLFATELCFAGEILLRNNRIVMPKKFHEQTLQLAHEGHPGMTIMKKRIRSKVWWPKIDVDVEKTVRQCHGCMLVAAPSAPEPLKRKQLPNAPWEHIAIDFLGPLPSGHNLLVVVDYYSRFIEVEIMKSITSSETIKRLEGIFVRFGYPHTITADGGPQLVSDEFQKYCDECNIQLITTTPYWPQMNGEVERQNRSILKRLVISQNTKRNWIDDLNKFLIMYRSTEHSTTNRTPADLLFNRNIRDKLPQISQPLEIDGELHDQDKRKKESGKQYADEKRQAKPSDINVGDEVLIKVMVKENKLSPNFHPKPFKIIERNGSEVTVESVESGQRYKRNVAHVKKIPAKPKPAEADDTATNNDIVQPDQPEELLVPDQSEELPAKRIRRKPARYVNQCESIENESRK